MTNFNSGHKVESSEITPFTNSRPLSDCRMAGAPKVRNIGSRVLATSSARFDVSALTMQTLKSD